MIRCSYKSQKKLCLPLRLFENMLETELYKPVDMFVIQRVKNIFPLFSGLDNLADPQNPQLMRHRRLVHLKDGGKIAYAKLRMIQGVEYFHSRLIAERFKQRGQIMQRFFSHHGFFHCSDFVGVKTPLPADFPFSFRQNATYLI